MRKIIMPFRKIMVMFIVLLMFISTTMEAYAAYAGGIALDENGTPIKTQQGLMPSTGDINIAVLLVEFQGTLHDEAHSKEAVEQMFFGETESLKEFYKNASYEKLNISGDVYGWYTLDHERDYYAQGEYPAREMILKEVLAKYDTQIDFSKYDNDEDGYIDGVYIYYAGNNDGFYSTWWSNVGQIFTEPNPDGVTIKQVAFINEYVDARVISHETGHLLGLVDYYDSDTGKDENYLGGNSLMYNNSGDLDGLSKILLGWAEPQRITTSGKVALRPVNESPDVAVIYPKGNSKRDSFFVVEYITDSKNSALSVEDGIRVYRVNAQKTEDMQFKYGVYAREPRFIEILAEGMTNGDELTPYTVPTTYLVSEVDSVINTEFTGITIDGIKVGDEQVEFSVSYDELQEKDVTYEIREFVVDNKIYLKLTFSVEMFLKNQETIVYASDGAEQIPMDFKLDNYPTVNCRNVFFLYTNEGQCEPNTKYTITIPKGTLVSCYGQENEEIKIEVTTSKYPDVKVQNIVQKDNGILCVSEDIIPIEEGKYVYFVMKKNDLCMITANLSGIVEEKKIFEVDGFESMLNYRRIQAHRLGNGEYVVLQRAESTTNILRIKTDGSVEKVDYTTDYRDSYVIGNKVVLSSVEQQSPIKVTIINEDNSLEEKELLDNMWFLLGIYPIQNGYYLITGDSNQVMIVDSEFDVVTGKTLNQLEQVFYAMKYKDYNVLIEVVKDGVKACFFDKDMNFLRKQEIIYSDNQYEFNQFHEVGDGYAISFGVDRSFNNIYGVQSFAGTVSSPIAHVVFFNSDFEIYSSYTMDYEKESYGDSVNSVVSLSNGQVIVSTNWECYCTEEMQLGTNKEDANEIFISDTDLAIVYGENKQLTVYDEKGEIVSNSELKWETTNPSVVTVEDGLISVIGNGKASVIARKGSMYVICLVETSGAPEPLKGISMNTPDLTLDKQEGSMLSVGPIPHYATEELGEIEWTSSDETVIRVEEIEDSQWVANIFSQGNGTAVVTAKTSKFSASCVVTVKNFELLEINVYGVTLNDTEVTLTQEGETKQLTATITPSNATNKNVTWSSTNPEVATVDSDGKVTAVSNGFTSITVVTEDGNYAAYCMVTVSIPENELPDIGELVSEVKLNKTSVNLSIEEKLQLQAIITPDNATIQEVEWTSSNEAVATVDANGKVTTLSVGSAIITATAKDGSGASGSCVINVSLKGENPFDDVPDDQWYYKYIKSAYNMGFMAGKKNDEVTGQVVFEPLVNMARAEFVQVLYNMEGKQEVEYTERFTDIPSGDWYTNAVLWAAEKNITSGNPNGSFGKYDSITREQLALMLMKYAKLKGYDVTGVADLSGYKDTAKVSSWAEGAISWAVANGIISGTGDGRINPQGATTRAEAATMLSKFNNKFME